MAISHAFGQRADLRAHARQPGHLARQGRGARAGEEVRARGLSDARAWRPTCCRFTTQIQIACDAAKFGIARLAGVEAPKFDDNETTLADLRERVRKTIDYLQSVPAAQIDGSEAKDISVPRRAGPMSMKGEAYLKHFALPNFFFHVTTTYALLRHNGVELGKMDFLGALPKPAPSAERSDARRGAVVARPCRAERASGDRCAKWRSSAARRRAASAWS